MFRTLRNSFVAGLVVVTPITVTVWLIITFITFVDNSVKPLIPKVYNPESYLPFAIPGLGLLFAVLFITMLGALAANFFGRTLVSIGERIVDRLPFVRTIYGTLKQIVQTIALQSEQSFQEVVLVEYPRPGLWAVGFVTAVAKGPLGAAFSEEHVGVFVPTTPNPTSGFLLYAPRASLQTLDMSVEEGAKLIVSAGLVTPDHPLSQRLNLAAVSQSSKDGSPGRD
jgi:uncharacterized membrane protein